MIYRETQLNLCSNSSTQAKDLLDFLLKTINQKNTPTIAHCGVMWGCVDCWMSFVIRWRFPLQFLPSPRHRIS